MASLLKTQVYKLPIFLIIRFIRLYQLSISPLSSGTCRFHPTCSQFAIDAFSRFGLLKGGWLSLKRLGRCHPWGGAGFDPVPKKMRTTVETFSNRYTN